jgi:GH43 family beta-xylosidase
MPLVLPRPLRTLALALSVVVAASLTAVAATPAPARAEVTFTSTVINVGGGACADVPGGAATSALQLRQNACGSAASQRFTFTPVAGVANTYTVGTLNGGMCVDIFGASSADNSTVIQYACHTGNNQRFRLQAVAIGGQTNTFNVIAVHSNKCVAPAGDSGGTNVGLVQLPCSSAGSRVWRLPSYTNGGGTTRTFANPLKQQGPDPWLQYHNGWYYLATTTWNNTVTMRRSRTLGGLASASDQVLFTMPAGQGTMWAPEFHLLNGPNGQRWYMYYVSGNANEDVNSQRIRVLESAGTDPMGPYTFRANMLDPQANNTWELDPNILQLNGRMFLLGTFFTPGVGQRNFIRELSNPWTAAGTRRVLAELSSGEGGVNEGAEVIQRDGRTFIIYSAVHCTSPDYHLRMLTYNGGDPLSSSSWVKSGGVVFQRNNAAGVYGPGHNGFFKSPDGTEDWIVYHATTNSAGNCRLDRSTRAQRFTWNANGTPNFGTPVALGTQLAVPSGEPAA